jgi:hypothetical protein
MMCWPDVMVTAHRRLPKASVPWLREQLPARLAKLRELYGTQRATSGMAIGGDHLFGFAAEQIRMPLRAAVPYPSQPLDGREGRFGQRWSRQQQGDWQHLCAYASVTGGLEQVYDHDPRSPGERVHMLHKRNDWMLERSQVVFALWVPERDGKVNDVGGTYSCIVKAVGAGMPVVLFDLTALTVTMPTPEHWALRLNLPALAVASRLW